MEVPAESHREFYRARANPPFNGPIMPMLAERAPCERGSRFRRHAFAHSDKGLRVVLTTNGGTLQVQVNGSWRTDIDPSYAGHGLNRTNCTDIPTSEWANAGKTCAERKNFLGSSYVGYCRRGGSSDVATRWPNLCQRSCWEIGLGYEGDTCFSWDGVPQDVELIVCEVFGGVIRVSGTGSCGTGYSVRWTYIAMPNVAIWMADPSTLPDASGLAFESGDSRFLTDKLFVAEDPGSDGCPLEAEDTVRVGSALYRHESRAVLLDSSPGGGRESKSRVCAPRGPLNGETCEVLPPGLGCRVACATPGEVPNRPRLGHQMHIRTLYSINSQSFPPSTDFDSNYAGLEGYLKYPDWRGAIWLEKALRGDDQLRQRVAWALAQIFVVAVPGLEGQSTASSEPYVNFYDIFVRNAFGSFGRLLREVTYSPLMANYLTYLNSKATDSDGSYPDENYAREIMQLFTIGTELLEQDGS